MIRFGNSGWRAIIGDTFTFRNVRLVTQAIANLVRRQAGADATSTSGAGVAGGVSPAASSPGSVRKGDRPKGDLKVVIGYDTRFLSERVASECATVLSASGILALRCERDAPTPAVALEVVSRGASGGIYFTASHNPPEYNGLKYYDRRGAPAATALTDEIELEVLRLQNQGFADTFIAEPRLIRAIDPQEAYLKHLVRSVDLETVRRSGMKLAIDNLYGTTREYLNQILIESDIAVDLLHNFADPYFGGYSPECSQRNLADLAKLVQESGAALGLAADGDGDRFGVLDRDGSFLPADDVLPMLLDYLAKKGKIERGVARTVATSHLLDRVASKHGLQVKETAVGFKFIAELLLSGEVGFGGEESAGLALAAHGPEKDGVLACLLIAEMVASTGKSLTESRAALWAEHGPHHHRSLSLELSKDCEARLKAFVQDPPAEIHGRRVVDVRRQDGAKLVLEDGSWCLLRRSGTEPMLRVYAESRTETDLERLVHAARGLVLGER